MATAHLIVSALLRRDGLRRLAAVPWYDLVPLRCHLAGEAAPGATYVVDRR